jgi:hypothetical protein
VRATREDLLRGKSIAPVFHVEDAPTLHEKLASRDVQFASQPNKSSIGVTVRFQDPDGHAFYLYQPSEKALRRPSGQRICEILGGRVQTVS